MLAHINHHIYFGVEMKRVVLLGLLAVNTAWADCQREDVAFYLSKGFTTDQITQLCASNNTELAAPQSTPASTTEIKPIESKSVLSSTSVEPVRPASEASDTSNQDRLIDSLSESLKVKDLKVINGKLHFRHKFRAKYGEEDVFGNLEDVKPWMHVIIDLNSMRLIRAGNRIPILRAGSVLLSGDIERTLLDKEKYKPKQLKGIKTYIAEETGDNTIRIKVNSDYQATIAGAELQELGLMYR